MFLEPSSEVVFRLLEEYFSANKSASLNFPSLALTPRLAQKTGKQRTGKQPMRVKALKELPNMTSATSAS